MKDINMKKAVVTFPITTGKKKRLITTYRSTDVGQKLKLKHQFDLHVLEQKYLVDNNIAFAYLKNQSIKQLVNKHLNNTFFYQFDIANFFDSINHEILLDKLKGTDDQWNKQLILEASNQKQCGLSLGLIPSPYLSNIYLSDFDQDLSLSLTNLNSNIVYTRYSDDLTISSTTELDLNTLNSLLSELLSTLELELNNNKTKYTYLSAKGQHLKILGLNIIRGKTSNYITVGRKFKSNTHLEKNFIRKHAMNAYISYNED